MPGGDSEGKERGVNGIGVEPRDEVAVEVEVEV
jgi:hypothetical protein